MQPRTFIGETAAQAVEHVRRELGPEAVVLNVRKLPAEGLARLWQHPRVEITALQPQPATPPEPGGAALAQLREELALIREQLTSRTSGEGHSGESIGLTCSGARPPVRATPKLRISEILEQSGLLPANVTRVLDAAGIATSPPGIFATAEQIEAVRRVLVSLWPPLPAFLSGCHVFVGPPGSGKTTALCRWLAQTVLVEGRQARVLRLDGDIANTAEGLSVFAEILSVPVERCCPEPGSLNGQEMVFVDLPGVAVADTSARRNLAQRISRLREPQVHLVLNAAYELQLLIPQARAFRELPITDVILSHADEDSRWPKLWNFVMGTDYTIGFLSGGQNVPGLFYPPEPKALLASQFPRK